MLDQLPETSHPQGPSDPLRRCETKARAKARYRSLQGAGATCLRARPTDIPAAEFVGMGRRFLGIEEHVAVRCPCCNAINVDTRHARICPRAGAQVDQHQPLLHAISRTSKRLGIPHQEESGEPFTAERNLRMDIVIRRGSLRDAPDGNIGTSPSYWTSPMQTRKRRYTCEEAVLITMDQLPLPPRRASVNTTLVRDMCPSTNGAINLPP